MAIAKIALRDKEHLAAMYHNGKVLIMNTLHWPDEIRSTEGLKGLEDEVKINPKELEMAKALIESLADSFDPSRYKDNYREAVMKVVRAKAEGEVIEAPEAPQPAKVMDLMAALRQSVVKAAKRVPPGSVIDGELVATDTDGRPNYPRLRQRLAAGARMQDEIPTAYLAFDALYLEGRPQLRQPVIRRRARLAKAVEAGG